MTFEARHMMMQGNAVSRFVSSHMGTGFYYDPGGLVAINPRWKLEALIDFLQISRTNPAIGHFHEQLF
jgi:hypothetical protein